MKAEPLKAKLTTKPRLCADAALTGTHLSNAGFYSNWLPPMLTVTFYYCTKYRVGHCCNSKTQKLAAQLLVRSSLDSEWNDLHTLDLCMDSVTHLKLGQGDHWKG